MAKDTRQVLADELRRILEEFRRLEDQVEHIAAERKRLGTIAQRLLQILRAQAPRGVDRLIEDMGLADTIALLPGVPGRKPAAGGARKAKGAPRVAKAAAVAEAKALVADKKAVVAPTPLPKGSPVRMLTGKYKGWAGTIRWITVKGATVSYTVDLNGRNGQKGRNQVRHGSEGSTWELLPAGTPAPVAATETKVRAPKRGAADKAKTVAARPAKTAAAPVSTEVLPKGTNVRLLKGKFQGGTGVIGWTSVKGSTVTYTIYLPGTGRKRDRTQVNQGSLGRSWELVSGPAPVAPKAAPAGKKAPRKVAAARTVTKAVAAPVAPKPAPDRVDAPKTVRRRRSVEATVVTPEAPKETAPVPVAPASSLPATILPKGTPVRMITGIYLGYVGVIASVQPIPGPKPDAVYTLVLKGAGGKKGRTSVKHGSLGRTWAKVN
jgi:hypothetical protein